MNILRCVLTLRRRNTRNKKVYRRFNWRQRRYIRYKNSELGCFDFNILTLRVQLVFANNRERVYFDQQILTLLLVHPTTNLSRIKFQLLTFGDKLRGFASREAVSRFSTWKLPCCDKTSLYSGKNITGATIGYNVAVANNNLRYYLRLPWRKKKPKQNKQTRPNF